MNTETLRFALSIAGVMILGLASMFFWILQVYISDNRQFRKDQNDQNSKFYDLINTAKEAIVKLTTTIELNQKVCDERHGHAKK